MTNSGSKLDQVGNQRLFGPGSVVFLGLFVLFALVACGTDADNRPSFVSDDATSSDTDSSPGETLLSNGDNADGSSSSTPSDKQSAEDERAVSESDSDAVPSVKLGSSMLAGKEFVNLVGRKVGVIASTASTGPEGHVVDMLMAAQGVDVVAIFSPEHGFRSDQPAGAEVDDEVDPATGLPIFSLYGDSYKPSAEMLAGIDVLVYDLQDVGTRYYTYIATLGLVMQAAAEEGIEVVVLDRPNPMGGGLVGGAVGPEGNISLVSPYPIPSVYGMTVGELAQAIVGEAWLDGLNDLRLTVVPMQGWDRHNLWDDTGLPWTPPSPGLPVVASALVYPAVVMFEATTVSYGQGTDRPFTQVGAPWLQAQDLAAELAALELPGVRFSATVFRPEPTPSAPSPRFSGEIIPGVSVEATGPSFDPALVGLHLLAAVQRQSPEPIIDRGAMFDLLAGSGRVRQQLAAGIAPEEIVGSWDSEIARFEAIRSLYLLYP